jgi:drug/metabolite transporter (DMT)-like permease
LAAAARLTVLALLAGFCFALTNIWLLRLQHTPESSRMLAMFGGGSLMALTCSALATWVGVIPALDGLGIGKDGPLLQTVTTWAPFVVGLSAAFLVSNFTLQYGAARLSAHTTSMVMMSEVVFAIIVVVAHWLGRRHDCVGSAAGLAGARRPTLRLNFERHPT